MTVCSKHFDRDSFTYPPEKSLRPRLKASALPSLFLPVTSSHSEERMASKRQDSIKRLARYSEINRKKSISNMSSEMPGLCSDTANDSAMSHVSKETIAVESHSAEELAAVDVLLGFQNFHSTRDNATQVCSGDLKTQHLIKAEDLNDRTLLSLTGLQSLSLLNFLAEAVGDEIKITNKHHLPMKERIILTMMKMYLNISFSSLAVLFGCTTKTACNIFFTIIPPLSGILGLFIEWLTKDEIIANLPCAFKSFQNVRIVLDCTEILVQKPQCLTERLDLYSHYYKDLTVKFMIGASPSGLITFVSRGYGGKTSDLHIFSESKLVEMLEPHVDAVMVDKGFLIHQICNENFIEVVQPPFLKNKTQFSADEAKLSRKIASARVHIERVIQRIKAYAIFKSTFPYNLIKVIDHMIIITAGLTNLSSPILGDDKFIFNNSENDNFDT